MATGCLDWRPFVKPTARHIPLTSSSSHAPAVHLSWPLAEIHRMFRLSLHHDDFEHFRKCKLDRYRQFHLDDKVVSACASWMPRIPSTIACQSAPVCNSNTNDTYILRVVLPFHPALTGGLRGALCNISETWNILLSGLLSRSVRVGVAFRNHGMPLQIELQEAVYDRN